mgnify:CR=1 FL=1
MLRKLLYTAVASATMLLSTPSQASVTLIASVDIIDLTVTAVRGEATLENITSLLTNAQGPIREIARVGQTQNLGGDFTPFIFSYRTAGRQSQLVAQFNIAALRDERADYFALNPIRGAVLVYEDGFVLFDYTRFTEPVVSATVCADGACGFRDEEGNFINLALEGVRLRERSLDQSLALDEFFLISDIPLPAVPEPATWLLMLMGFGGVAFALRRRTHSKALAL